MHSIGINQDTKQRPAIVTFDYPIWIKAVDIVLENKLPIIVRLSGFHELKSYLGSIGNVMSGSGLEELVKLVYPCTADVTATHIMDGSAYYKALRFHFLVDAALVVYMIKDLVAEDDIRLMEEFIKQTKTEKLGADATSASTLRFEELVEEKFQECLKSGRTPALWATYHNLVR